MFEKLFTNIIIRNIVIAIMIEADMKILKGYVLSYSNKNQEELINKTFGCTRLIHIYFFNDKIKEYKVTGKSRYDQIKLIPILSKEKEWLKEVDSCALRTSLFNLKDAFKSSSNVLFKYF